MKKFIFGLGALMMLFVMSACSGGVGKIESLTKDIEKNSEDWDTEKWVEVLKEAYQTAIDYMETDLKEKDFDKLTEAMDDFFDACKSSDSDKKYRNAAKKKEVSKLSEKYHSKKNKLYNKFNE
jgi:Na+/phosphate symporter